MSDRVKGQDASTAAGIEAPTAEPKAWSWSAFISTYLPALILALGTGIALPAIPKLAQSFHVSLAVATFVTTSFLIGGVLGTIPSGWMIDRLGRRRVMLLGPLLTSAMAFLVATAHTFPEICIYRFFDGAASQMWLMGRIAAISHGAAPSQRGRQVSWMFGMDNTGKFVGPVIGGFLAAAPFNVRTPFFAYGVLALVALVPAYKFTKDTPLAERTSSKSTAVSTISVKEIVRTRLVYFAVAFFAALTRGPAQASVYLIYVSFAYHLKNPHMIGFLAGAVGGLTLPIGFTAGWLMDRFGRKRTMVPGFTGVAVSMSGLAITAFLHLGLPWFIAIYLVSMAFQALTGGSIQTVGADVAPEGARGKFLGLWRFTGQGGTAISPIAYAILVNFSYGAAFLFISASACMVSYLVLRHVPETGGRSFREAANTSKDTAPNAVART